MGQADQVTMEAQSRDAEIQPAFREAMAHLAAGVCLVTTWINDRPWGLTVSAACSISLDPPLFLVSLRSGTASARAIEPAGAFGVGILGQELLAAAEAGSRPQAPKFVDEFCRDQTAEGFLAPVVADALAHIDCDVVHTTSAGDHTLFLGKVNRVAVSNVPDMPLLYYARGYRLLAESEDLGHVSLRLWPGESERYAYSYCW